MSVYLMLLCIEIFSELQNIDIVGGDSLNPKMSGHSSSKYKVNNNPHFLKPPFYLFYR
jgi:hypothetical protein